jgi:hypothetical protein
MQVHHTARVFGANLTVTFSCAAASHLRQTSHMSCEHLCDYCTYGCGLQAKVDGQPLTEVLVNGGKDGLPCSSCLCQRQILAPPRLWPVPLAARPDRLLCKHDEAKVEEIAATPLRQRAPLFQHLNVTTIHIYELARHSSKCTC